LLSEIPIHSSITEEVGVTLLTEVDGKTDAALIGCGTNGSKVGVGEELGILTEAGSGR
jgi:hypothetical protein